jgi:hypothetical protein
MRLAGLGCAALLFASAAPAMPVCVFLAKADALKARGPLALFSSDYGLLKNEIISNMTVLRNERLAAVKSGAKPAYCPTEASGRMDVDEVISAMNAVPAAERGRTDVKEALRQHLAQRFPCRS